MKMKMRKSRAVVTSSYKKWHTPRRKRSRDLVFDAGEEEIFSRKLQVPLTRYDPRTRPPFARKLGINSTNRHDNTAAVRVVCMSCVWSYSPLPWTFQWYPYFSTANEGLFASHGKNASVLWFCAFVHPFDKRTTPDLNRDNRCPTHATNVTLMS
jgi:hypothetical protein